MTAFGEGSNDVRGVIAERRKILLVAAPLIGGICLVSLPVVAELPHHSVWELAEFAVTGGLLMLLSLLLALRRISYSMAAYGTILLTAGLLLVRLLLMFTNGTFDDPSRSFFMAVYAHYATLYLLFVLLLPYPYSARCGLAAWLVMAVITTVGTAPYWHQNPPRQLLSALLVYVWFGHGLFVTLLFGWARQQKQLVEAHAGLAESERLARHAQEASDIRFRGIFDQLAAGIGLFGIDGRWQEVNTRLCELLGYLPEELLGQPMTAVTPPEDHAPFETRLQAMLSGPAPDYSVERRAIRKDGTVIWLQAQMRRLPTAPGQPVQGVLLIIDITERKLAEQKALESERRRDFQFEHSPLAKIEWTPDIRVARWSKQAESMFGWTEAEVAGRNPFEWGFFLEEDRMETEAIAQRLVEGAVNRESHLLRICRKDGSNGWYQWHHVTLRNTAGALESIYSMGSDVSVLRFALQAREDSEEQLRAVFEQAAVGISLLNADGSWRKVNQRLCEITGYSTRELLATNYQALTHPDDLSLDLDRANQLINGELDHYDIEKRLIHKQGHIIWVKVFASRLDATALQPALYVAVVEDISERRRAEREALEHQRVHQLHFENTPLAVIEWTPDLRVKRWSRRAETMFGWTEDEVLGRNAFDWPFVHEDDRDSIRMRIEAMLAGDEVMVATINRNYRSDGRLVWCHWYNSLLRGADGEIRSIYSLVNDVSEEQIASDALRESQARFRSIFEQAAVGIAMLDEAGRWLTVNARLCEIVGYSHDELVKLDFHAITHPDDISADAALAMQVVNGEIDHYDMEKRYVRKDGATVWIKLYVRRIDATATTPMRFVSVVEDISERKRSEASIHKLNTELERKVTDRTRQLQETMRHWAERNHELSLLAEMMGVLPAARDVQEANQIVGRFLPRLFKRYGGAVWIEDRMADRFGLIEQWRLPNSAPTTLVADDCWALRRGQPLRIDDPHDPLRCPHLHDQSANGTTMQEPHCCIPITALGDTVGLIHLSWSEHSGATVAPPDKALLASVAEQIGLAIGNVRLREELRKQATRDPLTGLFNRRHFDDCISRRVAEHTRSGRRFVLLMIDIDHFKTINDRYGHDAGDEVLRGTGSLLQRIVRADEAVFRLGGEEFVMLINEDAGTDITGCAERVRRMVEQQQLSWNGTTLPTITISIGVARHAIDGAEPTTLIQRADQALYAAKRTGRNRVCYASALPEQEPSIIAVIDSGSSGARKGSRYQRRLTDET